MSEKRSDAPAPPASPAAGVERDRAQGRIGAHSYAIEGPLLHLGLVGDLSRDHMVEILEHAAAILEREGQVFTLNDTRALGKVTPEARRYATEWMRTHRFDGSAIYGANIVVRATVTLLLRGINLLRSEPTVALFCSSEQEGRAWIDERRRR